MIRVTGETQKSEIAYAIQKYNKSTIYSYGDFCPSYLDTYMSTSYVSYTKPIFEVIKIPKILEKSSFFACVESKCVI